MTKFVMNVKLTGMIFFVLCLYTIHYSKFLMLDLI